MSNNLHNFKNCNKLSSSTPNREPNSKFRTPVNRSSAFEWSPNVQFGTPNINSPSLELPRTPAMLASLGINPESNADISLQSCMATPSSFTEAIVTTVYHTPTEPSDDKSNLQVHYNNILKLHLTLIICSLHINYSLASCSKTRQELPTFQKRCAI